MRLVLLSIVEQLRVRDTRPLERGSRGRMRPAALARGRVHLSHPLSHDLAALALQTHHADRHVADAIACLGRALVFYDESTWQGLSATRRAQLRAMARLEWACIRECLAKRRNPAPTILEARP